jgi:PAS domain S-box-containing protein
MIRGRREGCRRTRKVGGSQVLEAQALPPLVLCSIAFTGALYHAVLYPRRREHREYLTFSLVCVTVGLYDLCCVGLYGAGTPELGADWQRFQIVALCLIGLAFVWFQMDFMRLHPRPRTLWGVSAGFAVLAALCSWGPDSWSVLPVASVKSASVPSLGLYATYQECRLGPVSNIATAYGVLTAVWVAYLAWQYWRRGPSPRRAAVWASLAVAAVGVLNDTLVQAGAYHWFYMTEWTVLGFLVVVARALSLELLHSARLRAELAESEQRSQALVASSPAGILLLDCSPDGEVTLGAANPAAERMLGLVSSRDAGQPLSTLVPYLAELEVPARCREAAQTGGVWVGTHTRYQDGVVRGALELHVFSATPGHAAMIVVDSSDRLRAEQALRESRERYRTLVLASPNPIVTVSDEVILFANAAAARVLGWHRREDMLGLQLREITCPDDLPRLRTYLAERFREAPDDMRPLDVRLRTADGCALDTELIAGITTYDQRPSALVAFRDVTELRRASEQQAAMIQGLRTVVSMADDLVDSTDLDALLRRGVELARERLGVARASIYLWERDSRFRGTYGTDDRGGTTDERDVVLDDDEIALGLRASPQGHPTWGVRQAVRGYWRDGAETQLGPGWVAWTPIGAFPEPIGVFYNDAGYDSTPVDPVTQELLAIYCSLLGGLIERRRLDEERCALEERWQQAHRLESIGVLAGGIAHDINNILGIIRGCAEVSLARRQGSGNATDDLEHILVAVQRARDVVAQVLTFSRTAEVAKRPVQLDEVLREAVRFHRALLPAMVQIDLELPQEPAVTVAAETQLHQIVMNLCANAAHAMQGEGGTLTIRLDSVDLDQRRAEALGAPSPGRYHRLSVSDTGRGMPLEVARRAFEPYFTTKQPGEGTGLGLATVHGIVADHGGAVEIDSAAGHGTTVCVYLPTTDDGVERSEAQPQPPSAGTERILAVDDEPELLRVTTEMLTGVGYSVTATSDPQMALDLLTHDPQGYDALLTDQSMPGLTGLQLAGAARDLRPGLPVLLVTGYGHDLGDEATVAQRVDRILSKPYGVLELAGALREALDAHSLN